MTRRWPLGTHGREHRAHIMQKLRLASRSELVRYALNHGLLDKDAAGN